MTPLKERVRIAELDATPGGRALLRRFHDEAYVAQFPDPDERESLAQIARYLRLKAQGWYGANNYHVLVALQHGAPVGGIVLDYLALPNAGMVEFLFVLPAARGAGLGRRLLEAGLQRLRADARAQGRRLAAVAAEINDPYRWPAAPDNLDPFVRAAMWGGWGFHRLLCPYAQPALSAGQAPVDYLTLIVRPLAAPCSDRGVPADWVRSLVAEYMRWAMRIRHPARQAEYLRLDHYLAHDLAHGLAHGLADPPQVPLLPLRASIGDDPAFDTVPVTPAQRSFAPVARLAQRAIPVAGHGATPALFAAALAAARDGGPPYHLWRISLPGRRAVAGMAGFFSLPSAGFGGYLVLDRPLRGRGLLAPLLARIEARMMADGVARRPGTLPGWFIECADDTAPVFRSRGFADLPLDYHPPSLDGDGAAAPRLHLLFKPFGPPYPPIGLPRRQLLQALREILQHVYGIEQPARHASYRRALATLGRGEPGVVVQAPCTTTGSGRTRSAHSTPATSSAMPASVAGSGRLPRSTKA